MINRAAALREREKPLKTLLKKDIPVWVYYLLAALAVAAKLYVVSYQTIFIWTEGAPLDDGFMMNAAFHITDGEWLGAYNWLALSKHALFALWLSLLHALHIPFLLGTQLLWLGACALCTAAFSPVVAKRWQRLVLFGFMFFLPSSSASFTLRVYRDSIFPALCMLVFAGFIGAALRLYKHEGKSVVFLVCAGLGLGGAYLCREDGFWVLPFAFAAAGIVALFLVFQKQITHRLRRALTLCVPFVLMLACVLAYCGVNRAYYGRFIVSDFTSHEFNAAVGAMARVETQDENWNPKVSISFQTRQLLYQNVPQFAPFEPYLESEAFYKSYANANTKHKDYSSGSFYWAVRLAAQQLGVYDTPEGAQEFWQSLADEINRQCDEGLLPQGTGKRVSTMPPMRAQYIAPTVQEAFHGFWYSLTFEDTRCYYPDSLSYGLPKNIAAWETYTGELSNVAAVEGGSLPYYHPRAQKLYSVMDAVRWVYVIGAPAAFFAALALQIYHAVRMLRSKRRGQPVHGLMLWLILLGLLLMALLRCFIVAYVTVASFTIGTYVMYLSTVHPLLMLYSLAGLLSIPYLQSGEKLKTPAPVSAQ